jgi:uncharacterized protein YecE (DUF72 family)
MGKILLGTSGWSYDDWVGVFYRDRKESKLSAYARVFPTAEIDSTFYAYPSRGTVIGWSRYTGSDFVFTAKLPQLITHDKVLDLKSGVKDDVKRFCDLMSPLQLNGKLGCILIQLPPGFKFDLERLEGFFDILPSDFRFAVEFRHLSWLKTETWKLLKKYSIAYTIVDEPLLPPETEVTSDFAYFRWHGRGRRPWYNYRYSGEELSPWVSKINETIKNVEVAYGYFNNHYHGYAVENCLQVLEMLGVLTQNQAETKKRVERSRVSRVEAACEEGVAKLTAFVPKAEAAEMGLSDLLNAFIDRPRLERARAIGDDELKIEEFSDRRLIASIREYHVVIDFRERIIRHDCADWSRTLSLRQFCKHFGKLFLYLPKDGAVKILREIYFERDNWKFLPYDS